MERDDYFDWTYLPCIPDADGLAGIYAGVSCDVLLAAGGCNFPGGARPWTEGIKKWHSAVYLLDTPAGSWRRVGDLPRPVAYGISLSWNNRMICLGGRDGEAFYSDAFMLSWEHEQLNLEYLPALPVAHAHGCGVVVGNIIYIAGGQRSVTDQETMGDCWSMDLSQPPGLRRWENLEKIPGPSRMLSVAATCGKNMYIFSGVHLPAGQNPARVYLTDAYKYRPGLGWDPLPELPYPVAAAPGPASFIDGRIVMLGGDDGVIAGAGAVLKEAHPGFSRGILQFDLHSNAWRSFASLPGVGAYQNTTREIFPAVTTPSVQWRERIVVPAGETKPGFRTSQVIAGSYKSMKQP